ncbi:MAG TPA: AraC family transcriptional regulator [Polyangiaceae bacterium]|jgi:AraC-like DNA-binding protein
MAIGLIYRPLLEAAREAGAPIERLLERQGLTEPQLLDPSTRLSPERGTALARSLIRAAGDAEIGLRAAERFQRGDADLLGYLAGESPHALGALETIAQYVRLLGDSFAFEVEPARKDGVVAILLGRSGARPLIPEMVDMLSGAIVLFVRGRSGGRVNPLGVKLPRPSPARPERYRRFFGCPVAFAAGRGIVRYVEVSLRTPFSGADPRLAEILHESARGSLSRLPQGDSLIDRVRANVTARLEKGTVHIDDVATELAMSERTLRRHLAAAGVAYRDLLDEVRRDRATMLLGEGRSVTETALLVGFLDATSFTRAFRRWTGVLPRDYSSRSARPTR